MEAKIVNDSRTVKDFEDDEYVRKDKRTAYLLERHHAIVSGGFKPRAVAVNDSDKVHPLIHQTCDVCDYDDLLGIIEWINPATGGLRHTGFTCFGRVAKNLEGISEKDRLTLRWVSQNRHVFYDRKYFIVEAEHIRLCSYKDPVKSVYGSRWSRAVSDVYPRRAELGLSGLQLGVLETLHSESGPYFRGDPTPRQRVILNGIIRVYLEAGFEPSE
jgi:hypothetical protein